MQRFKNWLITALLKKDKLVAVPQSWQTDYVKLAGDKVKRNGTIAMLVTEYNNLLKDFFNKCTIKELHTELADSDVKVKAGMSKEELVELAYNEFRMTVEKD
jgi:hypothetical protein